MMAIRSGFWRYAHGILCSITLLCLVFLPCMGVMATAADEKPWYPVAVDVWQPPFNEMRQRVQKMYVPLEKAQRSWRISAFIPHLKDAYWLGVNYGLIDEARRLGVSLSIYEAGGYGRLGVQRKQIEEMLSNNTNKPDGLIIAAISQDGLNDIVKKAHGLGIPVVDLINGLSSPLISARAAATFWDNGYQTGMYLRRIQEKTGKPMRVAWFPGPKGAGWVAAGNTGFNEAITGGDIKIMCTLHGDTGAAVQGKLVETALDQHGDNLDFIVGTAATTEASVKILRKRGLSNQIKLLSYYYGPSVHRGIRRGRILAAPTDSQVLQARIALDILVRILEKKDYFKHAAPRVMVVDRDNIRTWDSSTTLSPRGFRPVFSIN
jgi:periplasmic protein TorT